MTGVLFCVCLLIQLASADANQFFFRQPLPTNENPCACVDDAEAECEVVGVIRVEHISTSPAPFTPCMCWPSALTLNKTIDILAYCKHIPNTVTQLHIAMMPRSTVHCAGQADTAVATCEELAVRVAAPHEMWVVKPDGRWGMIPRGGYFTDDIRLDAPLVEQRNATWSFFPADLRCSPFVITTHTPDGCVYNPRVYELRFSESHVGLNLLIWCGILVSYTFFLGSGNFQRHPNSALVFTVGVIIAYVPCSYNLGYSGLILAWLLSWLCWTLVTIGKSVFVFYKHGIKRFRVPDTFTLTGTGAVLEFYVGLLIVLLVMANNK